MNKDALKKNISKGIKEGKNTVKKTVEKIVEKINEVKDNSSHDYYDYIEYYGDYSFEEREFNEIDNIILSMLSYVDFTGIVSENNKNKKSISEISSIFFSKYTKKDIDKNITATREGIKLLEKISNTKRFKDVELFNYLYLGDENSQFSAITFDLKNGIYYIGFEGTDKLISGWEEDCKMAYSFPVEAHMLSKKYIDKFTLTKNKLIIGGHSKGGNLALVASMYSNFFVKRKIIKIYSNDGQGLRLAQIESKYYKKIEDRFIHIIPDSSIVGLLLRHTDKYIVVKSNMPGLISHNPATWQINYNTFQRAKLTRFSKVFDDGFSKWLDNYDDEKRRLFVKSMFDILRENKIETLLQFKDNYKLIQKVIKSSKNIDPIVKEMGMELIKVIAKTNLEYPLL